MRTIGNILWHIPFLGFLLALIIFLLGGLLVITVVGSPIGLGLIQYSRFLLAPFSSAMVSKADMGIKQNPLWKTYSTVIWILYLPFGIILCALSILQIIGMALTIIGIPIAIVVAKSLGTYFKPINKKCVPVAVAAELDQRKAKAQVDKHLGNLVTNP
ncbi:MAG: YccF domain-containing protein [Lentimicrobium sp.]